MGIHRAFVTNAGHWFMLVTVLSLIESHTCDVCVVWYYYYTV